MLLCFAIAIPACDPYLVGTFVESDLTSSVPFGSPYAQFAGPLRVETDAAKGDRLEDIHASLL